jgi:hypothetical protein|tara:strand:- start:427 stop:759 length:333 start_codon:yes stop_codon:yes gene_type:complete
MNFDSKIPLALIITVLIQAAGIIWWVSQQAQTIEILKEEMSSVSSRMAIEETVNLKRDVQEHGAQLDDILEDLNGLTRISNMQSEALRRISVLETRIGFLQRRPQGAGSR